MGGRFLFIEHCSMDTGLSIKTCFDMTYAEERKFNDPAITFKPLVENYKKTVNSAGIHLYTHPEYEFHNTKIISEAANYFKRYGTYTDIDPNHSPIAWKEFWDRWEYRRLYGMTLPVATPKGGGLSDKDLINVWIPGKMVGHLNFGPIMRVKNEEDAITAGDAVKKQIDQTIKSNEEKLNELFATLSDKKVMDSTFDFPDFWDGHYNFWVASEFAKRLGLDISVLKARRKGYSYVGGWDTFDDWDIISNSFTLLIAYDMKYLTSVGALFDMIRNYSDFINKHTDWRKRRIVDTEDEMQSGFTYRASSDVHGFKSIIMAVSAKDNPSCGRGKRATKVKYEESGSFPNLLETIAATAATNEAGSFTIGQSTIWATASSKATEFGPFSKIHKNPQGFNCLAFADTYEPDGKGRAVGFVHPIQLTYEGYIDEHGNSDEEKALEYFNKLKAYKEATLSFTDYQNWLIERFTRPSQVLNTKFNNIFSRIHNVINDTLEFLDEPYMRNAEVHGRYVHTGEGIRFMTNADLESKGLVWHPPVDDSKEDLPKGYDLTGCVTIWDFPFKQVVIENGRPVGFSVPPNLYVAWLDPYATDKFKDDITLEDSLGACYIFELPNTYTPSRGMRCVARLLGRPERTDDYNEQLFHLLDDFNAKILFENDRGDTYQYATRKGKTYRLIEEPEMLSMRELSGKTGRRYGISIGKNPLRKGEGARKLLDFLTTPLGKDVNGNEKIFVQTIKCRRFLKEIKSWNLQDNFDCVSSWIVGMYLVQEILDKVADNPEEAQEVLDDFFNRQFF